MPDAKFKAFISYSHADAKWARWLHRTLETYRLPRQAARQVGARRLGRVFLDRSELATSAALSADIQAALDASECLVVICSPASARSRWVNEEVRRFRSVGGADRIFCLVVEASADGSPAFPPALVEPSDLGASTVEPLAADVRPHADGRGAAKLKIIAGLLGVSYDQLRRREQTRRVVRLTLATVVLSLLLLVMTCLTVFAFLSRRAADNRTLAAQNTLEVLLGVLGQAAPNSAGADMTLRQVIGAAADLTLRDRELRASPDVRTELVTDLAEILLEGGDIARAESTLAQAGPSLDPVVRVQQLRLRAQLAFAREDDGAAATLIARARAAIGRGDRLSSSLPKVLFIAGQIANARGDAQGAERDFAEARARALELTPPDHDVATSALLAAAVADVDHDQLERGAARARQVVAERTAAGRPRHPDVVTALNELGAVAVKRGDPAAGEVAFRRTLELQTQVVGPETLEVALARNNLGRTLVEQRRFTEARDQLLAARALFLAKGGPRLAALAALGDSLGLAYAGLNDRSSARASYAAGLAVAQANALPKEIELYTDAAEALCDGGEVAAGLRAVGDARAALARFALPEPWRVARIDMVEGGCRLATGPRADAVRLLARSTPQVLSRWGAQSLFGSRARAALARAQRRGNN